MRGVGLIWSGRLSRPGRVSNQAFHVTDWLPTLVKAAGGNTEVLFDTNKIDGVDAWEALTDDKDSPRKIILHNIDNVQGIASITIGDWKLIKGEYVLRFFPYSRRTSIFYS